MSLPLPLPVYFGSKDRPLFGLLHRPSGIYNRVGIVLCNPIGYEAITSHRTYRHLAQAAADLGFPALRFDYDGTGNSAGLELDPKRVESWVESISVAIDNIKRLTGVIEVCLFGLRLGASLAAIAAQGRDDVSSLIAFAPVVSVRTYLREIRALAMADSQLPSLDRPAVDPSIQEAAGFPTTEETRSALSSIDLLNIPLKVSNILICERDDLPSQDAWQAYLTNQGCNIRTSQLSGYADMMQDAHASIVPTSSIQASLEWLQTQSLDSPPPYTVEGNNLKLEFEATATLSVPSGVGSLRVKETPAFIEPNGLFGILTEPVGEASSGHRKDVLVLLNSGSIHNIGPHRLYVNLARECAASGFAVLRLDISGLGESQPRAGRLENITYAPDAIDDVRRVLVFARKSFPKSRLHVGGVCSGAYHSLKAAMQGERVQSVIAINPLTFFWKEGNSLGSSNSQVIAESSRYRRTAFKLSAWFKLLRGEVDTAAALRIFLKRLALIASSGMRELGRVLRVPLKDDLASELRLLAQKKIDMYFVFSASDPGLSMLYEQGGRRVGLLLSHKSLRISVIDGADHTFTAGWTRQRLNSLLLSHLNRYA